jgi:hypothetical protein
MAASDPGHQHRVTEFKNDLREMDLTKLIRKHITTGGSAVFTDSIYYELRDTIADHFNLHPSAVVLVGSGRLGFSLKPTKRYEPFGASSDLDFAVVSGDAFDLYWDRLFNHSRSDRIWSGTKRYKSFLRELFKGWLWPRRFPPSPTFREAVAWVEFEDRLGRESFKGRRSVGVRLYHSWERLEAYQSLHVIDCRTALSRESK